MSCLFKKTVSFYRKRNEEKRTSELLEKYRHRPNGEAVALAQSPYHFARPLQTIKNLFNSTAPVVMSHLSKLENNIFHSTKDNLKGLFEDRFLLDRKIGSFKSLSSNTQTVLQIFAYGNESKESKYNSFYHYMGILEGSGRSSEIVGRDYNSAIKELYHNMNPTKRNIFVLDELIKERDKFGQASPYVKNIGQLTTDFLESENQNSDIVENQYNWYFPETGEKTDRQRDIQQRLFGLSNLKAALQIGMISPGSTNISTTAHRFSTQGDSGTHPNGVLKQHASREGDQVGALRHPVWQAGITATFGEDVASRVADAHERYRTLDLNVRHFSTRPEADQTADMLNNREGRKIGKKNPNMPMKVQAKAVLNHFHKDGLYVIKEDASGFSVVKEKITDEQFHYMKSQFDRGDDNGFSPEQIAAGKRNEPLTKYYP
ncbi:DUF6973 domain-containing protein [Xenorhabdus sp. IM139775]|uniref:DUF6973 domain-containing protein n=1 Tax=Xenorhabdus sp. IM139775 TaxID=3025876 RepID=UPI002358216D|nr:hypothetical protein [Xenorhabdus sp. IM139775]MDC9594774.1 hypothetical protein [Xenorhabdus sp. IM139775]